MRVLFVPKDFPTPDAPHASVFVLRQALALRELGHEIVVALVVPYAPPIGARWKQYAAIPPAYEVEGIFVHVLRAAFPPRMLAMEYLPWQVSQRIRRLARSSGADLLHAHFVLPSGHIAVRTGYPTVVTGHGSDAYAWAWRRPGLTNAAREAVDRAGRVVAVSAFIRDQLLRLSTRGIEVVYNGADHRVFFPRERPAARAALGLPLDRPVVAFAGRIEKAKGVFDLLAALGALHDLRPIALLAGDGIGMEQAQHTARALGVDARFCGPVDHVALATNFAAADLVALPSYNEGLPVVLCEAMLAGRPVVATPVGGISEIVSEAKTGKLVPPGDVESLSRAMREIFENAQLRDAYGRAAYDFAADRLTWRANARAHDRIYRSLLDERPNTRATSQSRR